MKQNPAIIIMAKTPRAGFVKTRLGPILSERECAEIAACFLKDAVIKSFLVTENVFVAFSPADSRTEIEKLVPNKTNLLVQEGEDLGERMKSAFLMAEKQNFSPIVMIGTDSPTLPVEFLKKALEAFFNAQTKIVLGKSEDGGFYLIGLRNWTEGLFENVEWSSEETFKKTFENARKLFNENPFQIPAWFDVDTPQDFERLIENYSLDNSFGISAPNTAEWLKIHYQEF